MLDDDDDDDDDDDRASRILSNGDILVLLRQGALS
jgi:hypothetical protein